MLLNGYMVPNGTDFKLTYSFVYPAGHRFLLRTRANTLLRSDAISYSRMIAYVRSNISHHIHSGRSLRVHFCTRQVIAFF